MNKSNVPAPVRRAAQRVVTLRAFRAPQREQQTAQKTLRQAIAAWRKVSPAGFDAAMTDLRRRAASIDTKENAA